MIKYNSGLFDQNTSVGFDAALKYQKISKLLGLPASDIKEGVVMLTKSIRLLNMELGIPTSIKNAGIEESEYMGRYIIWRKMLWKIYAHRGIHVYRQRSNFDRFW